jgi:hypothetical protein
LHIRTGSRASVQLVDRWLERQQVEVLACADAFDACVAVLRKDAPPIGLALLGADWLDPEDFALIRLLHEHVPGLAIVLYGYAGLPQEPAHAGPLLVCRSAVDLEHALQDELDGLVARVRRQASGTSRNLTGTGQDPSLPDPRRSNLRTRRGDSDHLSDGPAQEADGIDAAGRPALRRAASRSPAGTAVGGARSAPEPEAVRHAGALSTDSPTTTTTGGTLPAAMPDTGVRPASPRTIHSREELKALLRDTGW